MGMYTIIIGALSIFLLLSLYVNYQLYKKVLFFENWYENFANVVETIYENMQIMDKRGVMESDDEFAAFFEAMRDMMIELFSMGFYSPEEIEDLESESTEPNENQPQT